MHARGSGERLRSRGAKLLGETTNGQRALVLSDLKTHLRLSFSAAARSPIENRNRKIESSRNARVLSQSRRSQRICVEASVEGIGGLRAAPCARFVFVLLSRATLRLPLRKFPAARDCLRCE